MKGQIAECLRCKTEIVKRNDKHKYCSNSCRSIHNRELKGIPSPFAASKPSAINSEGMTIDEFKNWWIKGKPMNAQTMALLSNFVTEYKTVNKLMAENKIQIHPTEYKD